MVISNRPLGPPLKKVTFLSGLDLEPRRAAPLDPLPPMGGVRRTQGPHGYRGGAGSGRREPWIYLVFAFSPQTARRAAPSWRSWIRLYPSFTSVPRWGRVVPPIGHGAHFCILPTCLRVLIRGGGGWRLSLSRLKVCATTRFWSKSCRPPCVAFAPPLLPNPPHPPHTPQSSNPPYCGSFGSRIAPKPRPHILNRCVSGRK